MRRNVLLIAVGVAVLCGWMFWSQYLAHVGSFVDGRYVDPETGRAYVERAGWMWGALGLVALVLGFAVSRR